MLFVTWGEDEGPRMAGRPRDPTLDRAILHSASVVLTEVGFAGFTVDAVAAHRNLPKSTIYKRWASRSALLSQLLAQRLATMSDVEPDRTRGLRPVLVEAIATEISLSRTREGLAIAQALLAARDGARGDFDVLVAAADHRRDGLRRLLDDASRRGELLADADLDLLLDLLVGAVWAAVLRGKPRRVGDAERIVDAILATVLRR